MSSIMDLIGAELSELFALEFAKIAESDFVFTLASTNESRTVRVICPSFKKTVTFDFVYILSSAHIDQSAPTLGKIFMTNRL